ncbi:hypothetical protein [Pseudomonas sp. GV071]|uniref:hypothetical protein n=1 Tax=Pseudomonas sp. GV071 TaxID=2135754 RepID=UPI000D385042|nr:hypothetical protein [Pseudomonas sp. GV071]PTQ70361.1 hypothetical protein C8K61_10683 [Pseudomonas sp. GV071]
MALTLVQARGMLQRYLDAELEILDGKSVTFSGRTLTMVDLADIQKGRLEWERKVATLQGAARGRKPYKLASFSNECD